MTDEYAPVAPEKSFPKEAMISLPSVPSDQPLEPGAGLIGHLAASPRPAVIHYTPDGRTELSGRVAVNWATKTTHLVESYGIQAPDPVLIDVPVTWRTTVLALGFAWSQLAWTTDVDEAAAIFTDRPDDYLSADGEIFVTHQESVDPALVNIDDEVLSHPDQALLGQADIIADAQTNTSADPQVTVLGSGTVINTAQLRLNRAVWSAMVDAWRSSHPVVLVDEADAEQLARIIDTEHLR